MTDTFRKCAEQDCKKPSNKPDQPLCYKHYRERKDGTISLCSDCEVTYKPEKYPVCRTCLKQRPPVSPPPPTHDSVSAVETARKNIELHWDSCTNHETNTIDYLVIPLLEGLGWNPQNPSEVLSEYAPTGKRWHGYHKRVDFALFEGKDPMVFIEVKRLDRDLSDPEYMDQIESYASNMNSGFAVLTNGQCWLVSSVTGDGLKHIETVNIQEGSVNRAAKSLRDLLGKTAIGRLAKRPTSEQITNALKNYRNREARRRRTPAYTIFSDATIARIAGRKPANIAELQCIKGVGPKTLKQHGKAILEIVAGRMK